MVDWRWQKAVGLLCINCYISCKTWFDTSSILGFYKRAFRPWSISSPFYQSFANMHPLKHINLCFTFVPIQINMKFYPEISPENVILYIAYRLLVAATAATAWLKIIRIVHLPSCDFSDTSKCNLAQLHGTHTQTSLSLFPETLFIISLEAKWPVC